MIINHCDSLHMANPTHLDTREEDHKVSTPNLHRLLALQDNHDTGMASEVLMRLSSLFGEDAPRDHFTATSAFPKTSSLTNASSPTQETDSMIRSSVDPMHIARERTDSEKAVKGSDDDCPTDNQVIFQKEKVRGVGGIIPNDSSEELNRRGKEAEAIINGTDRAFSGYFGSHFDKEVSEELELWPLAASSREDAEAMVKGLERAHGK